MAVAVETVALRKLNLVVGVPVAVAIPVFSADNIVITYGSQELATVQNTDYTVTLEDERNFDTFSFTPLQPLIDKIDALIAADDTEINAVIVRRELDYLTESSPAYAMFTRYLSTQHDKTVARFQQIAEPLSRSWKSPFGSVAGTILPGATGTLPMFDAGGDIVQSPIDAASVAAVPGLAASTATNAGIAVSAAIAAAASAAAAQATVLNKADLVMLTPQQFAAAVRAPFVGAVNNYVDEANLELGGIKWNANVFEVGTSALGSGTGRAMTFRSAAGSILLTNTPGTDFANLRFGGLTAADIALQKFGVRFRVRKGDDSGPGALQHNDHIVVVNSATTLTADNSGTHYRNAGAGSMVVMTLPTAADGLIFKFTNQASVGFRALATGSNTISFGAVVSSAAGYIQSRVVGGSFVLRGTSTGWVVEACTDLVHIDTIGRRSEGLLYGDLARSVAGGSAGRDSVENCIFYWRGNVTGGGSDAGYDIDHALIEVTGDLTAATGQLVNALKVTHAFGGGSSAGGFNTVQFNLDHIGATLNTNGYYVAVSAQAQARANDGGISGATKGHLFGENLNVRLLSGATYWNQVVGSEINLAVLTGASVSEKIGIQIVKPANDTVKGIDKDYAFIISDQADANVTGIGWDIGISFGARQGYNAMQSTGTLIGAILHNGSVGQVGTVAYGIDLSLYTFSTAFLKSTGFVVDGLGNVAAKAVDVATGGVYKINNVQVVKAPITGWAIDTGTAKRTANTTYTAPTISALYVQAEVQAIAAAVQDVSRTVKALKDDFFTTSGHGLLAA